MLWSRDLALNNFYFGLALNTDKMWLTAVTMYEKFEFYGMVNVTVSAVTVVVLCMMYSFYTAYVSIHSGFLCRDN